MCRLPKVCWKKTVLESRLWERILILEDTWLPRSHNYKINHQVNLEGHLMVTDVIETEYMHWNTNLIKDFLPK